MPPRPSSTPSQVTLRTLAAKVGISAAAVSFALRNKPGVSPATRARVLALAEKLGYRPNPLVSAYQAHVRSARKVRYQANLAWINDQAAPDFWHKQFWTAGYLEGARQRAATLGFKLEEFHLAQFGPDSSVALPRLERVLRTRGIEGILLPWPRETSTAGFGWRQFSVAMIGRNPAARRDWLAEPALVPFHHATVDAYFNMQVAWRELYALGCRRIALVMERLSDVLVEGQQRACFLVMQETLHPEDRLPPLVSPDLLADENLGEVRSWIAAHRPDGILTYDIRLEDQKRFRDLTPRVAQLNLTPDYPASTLGIDARHTEVGAAAVDLVVAQLYRNERGSPSVSHEVLIKGIWRRQK